MWLAAVVTLLMEVDSGRVLAANNAGEAESRLVTPGSTVKPFTLLALERQGKLGDNPRVSCLGRLTIGNRRLDCSHPRLAMPVDAQAALAYSCNTWFARMARRLERGAFLALLREYGFLAPGAEIELTALGEAGVNTTPLNLAKAYRRLVRERLYPGLREAVEFGSGQLAAVEGLAVAGKTGTTATASRLSTHGWFAGYAPASKPEVVVVVFVEQGKGGATAAPVAGELLGRWWRGGRR
jgi:cell division protein FtsI/penicillin-binding protein 2